MTKVLPPYYGSVFIMHRKGKCNGMIKTDLWRFKSQKSGKTYLVEVEVYERHIYGIKFYLKSQSHLDQKYSFMTNDFEPRRIILSCIHIMYEYFKQDTRSSFAFIGVNSPNENTISNTKRFRFYRTIVNTYFGRDIFEHRVDENNSAYLLLRKTEISQGRIEIREIENFFRNIYILQNSTIQ